jgi:putative SOS response-associated peptidase YedK
MCGRFAMNKETDELITDFVAEGGDFRDWRPGYNIAPTDTIPVVIQSAKGGDEAVRRLEPARWSLVPSWSKELKLRYPTFNARSENIATKATWKGPLKSHRALVYVGSRGHEGCLLLAGEGLVEDEASVPLRAGGPVG